MKTDLMKLGSSSSQVLTNTWEAHQKVWNKKISTRNWDGVSSVLKSEEEDIPSSRVSKNTFWKSSISGRLPNKDSIWEKQTALMHLTVVLHKQSLKEMWQEVAEAKNISDNTS